MKKLISLLAILASFAAWSHAAEIKASDGDTTLNGEVLDMACYLDHGAHGAGHAACAEKCIRSGLPVGLKTADGKVFLLIGEHKPINSEVAVYAGKSITVHGKLVTRDGMNLLENAEIVGH